MVEKLLDEKQKEIQMLAEYNGWWTMVLDDIMKVVGTKSPIKAARIAKNQRPNEPFAHAEIDAAKRRKQGRKVENS